jgi:pimeloyl-ACP methyl ester carboxylesterase
MVSGAAPSQESPRDRPVVLVHGAATTAAIWRPVAARLARHGIRAHCPQRAYSGRLSTEVADLEPIVTDTVVVGVSGGATLGLALAAQAVPLRVALLHEPAVGSLVPGLLTPFAHAFATGGVAAFGRELYGPGWTPGDAPADPDCVTRDLAMFGDFEPSAPPAGWSGQVIVTVGADSPPVRHRAAEALADRFGYPVRVIPAAKHAVHIDAPTRLADLIAEYV